jgi:hypothetical protein
VEPDRLARRDPRRAKDLDYDHQRRSGAEYPHAWRRALPAKKARSERAARRGAAAALRAARGANDPTSVERAESRADRVRRRSVRSWPNPTLRDHVTRGARARLDRVGWNFFKRRYDPALHRDAFIAFLTALTAARRDRALAARFDAILRTPTPAPDTIAWEARRWPPDASRQRAWLAEFFADEPDWQPRLQAWIAATLSTARRRQA